MSEVTATYTLGELESWQCHRCGTIYHGGSDMEVVCNPEGWVQVHCFPCVEELEKADNDAVTASAEYLFGPAESQCAVCSHSLDWHGSSGCNVEDCECSCYEMKPPIAPDVRHAIDVAKCASCGKFHSECICK